MSIKEFLKPSIGKMILSLALLFFPIRTGRVMCVPPPEIGCWFEKTWGVLITKLLFPWKPSSIAVLIIALMIGYLVSCFAFFVVLKRKKEQS